jgi:hypothetical protein
LHTRLDTGVAHGVLQCERVHHGGEHAHVVGRCTVHTGRTACHAAKNITAADDDRELRAHAHHFRDVCHHPFDCRAIDAEGIVAH